MYHIIELHKGLQLAVSMKARNDMLFASQPPASAIGRFSKAAGTSLAWLSRRQNVLVPLAIFLPTILAGIYYFGLAKDQYESEARFVVRSAAKPQMPGGLGFLVQLGLARSQDDSFVVQDFMTSRDAIDQLQAKLPLRNMFQQGDFLSKYPSLLYGKSDEQFYRYFQRMVSVVHVDKTGIATLTTRAFRGTDAYDLAITLLGLSEALINRMNARLHSDAVSASATELENAQKRVVDAQTALTDFRNRELIVDPANNAVALAELVARLSTELAGTQAQLAETRAASSSSPQVPLLQRKMRALEDQIAQERRRISDDGTGLAARISRYERLSLEREFANRMLSAAETELARAKGEASRQQLYLERLVQPHVPDHSTLPKRARALLTVFAANLLFALVGWLIYAGIQEHVPNAR